MKKATSTPKKGAAPVTTPKRVVAAASTPTFSAAVSKVIEPEDLSGIPTILKFGILGLICLLAFSIRLFAVVRYESVIHEFDPYFNFRTTKYLAHEGFLEFLNWFDDRGWYPLGRTIGGTIYPGLMLTAALFYWVLNFLNVTINIRNMCVFIAPIFSALAAISSYLLTTEVTKRSAAGLLAAAFTAVVPSYISRSVGGSYDNEGVAIFALIFTFYLWVKSVHTGSMMWSCLCALSYYYMVAAWGGYVFIINIIPIFTVIMIVGGRYSSRLYVAYSVFYTLGSLMAMTVPFVGFNVVNQAECAASHGVFAAVQVFAFVSYLFSIMDAKVIRSLFTTLAFFLVAGVAFALISLQLLGKIQWSGRSLTLLDPTYASKYIPIIASVSEHQPTTWTSFFFDLHILVPLAPVGLFTLFSNITDGGIFVILYGTLAWYFAGVMVRLMLTLAPIACVLAAIGLSGIMTRFSALLKGSLGMHSPTPSTPGTPGTP
ncbi:STT3 subunit of Oligosaccharyl transferase, partial [Ochromonadaceae sp. CCMP2298]